MNNEWIIGQVGGEKRPVAVIGSKHDGNCCSALQQRWEHDPEEEGHALSPYMSKGLVKTNPIHLLSKHDLVYGEGERDVDKRGNGATKVVVALPLGRLLVTSLAQRPRSPNSRDTSGILGHCRPFVRHLTN